KAAAGTSFRKVRDFIFDLRPMMLDDLGLAPTVHRYVEAFQEKSGIDTHLNVVGEERRRMENHTEVLMFRGIQEVLGYARDMCGSTRIDMVLEISSSPIKANISFNGKNMDEVEAAAVESGNKLAGLGQLKERMSLVGGELDMSGSDTDVNRVDIGLPTALV
ncbi:MAG TPA: hypothetical protein VMT34_17220, partial [Aggregatilineales bacterium]|nr:hypothetical protein [Aggregatilineales bacterium]